MQVKWQTKNVNAFTLIEALVSMFIIGTTFVSIYGGISLGLTSAAWTREQLRASEIIEEKIEFLRLCNWDQINSVKFIPAKFEEPFSKESDQLSPQMFYKGVVDIKRLPGTFVESYRDNLREVTITVSWNQGGEIRTYQATTFLSKNGLQNYIPL